MASQDRYDSADRHRRMQRWAAIDRLASIEIQQFAEGDGLCPSCGTETYRILDESKISLPLEGFVESLHSIQGHNVPFRVLLNNAYEATQDVVRSGLFSRDQLGGLCLTEHELEVCQAHFLESRPLRCDCHFGSEPEYSEYELALLADMQVGQDKPMDALFASTGARPRTGFRRRSPDAIRRRRRKSRVVGPAPDIIRYTVEELLQLRPVEPVMPRMSRPALIRPKRRITNRPPWSKRKVMVKSITLYFGAPQRHHLKYWYFKRKRGYYYHSLHHPYGDEITEQSVGWRLSRRRFFT